MQSQLDKVKICEYFKSIRENNNYNKLEFSKLLNISVKKIISIEKGETFPSLLDIALIREKFGINPNDFVIFVEKD